MPPRQTQSYLRNLFAQRGISPRHRLGQNFLIDLNIHELIADTAGVNSNDVVLEVGPGAGALSSLMATRGATVVAVELDSELARLTQEAVASLPTVQVLCTDTLANKNTVNPLVVDSLKGLLCTVPGKIFKLVANLPYNVATPIITNLLVHQDLCPALMVVTIQRELAERMIAHPSTPYYGSLSVLLQSLSEVSIVRTLPPSVFWPRPKVESAVVWIRPDPARRATTNIPWFHDIVRKIFLHRRKNLRRVLASNWSQCWNKDEVDCWLRSLGLDGQLRAEALNIDQFRLLTTALEKRIGSISVRACDQPGL
jgi:16S rRNA (adenine1518-N6/adenine1519-N6)-dimethyltransferase